MDLDKAKCSNLHSDLDSIREELEDHLTSINQNTDEIENNYSYLMEIDQRLALMEKKINCVYEMLSELTGKKLISSQRQVKITESEQEVFMIFYTSDRAVSYEDVCSRLNKSESFVRFNLNNLLTKGIPIHRSKINGKSYFLLEGAFKELQAKTNVLNLARTLTLDCFDQKILE